MTKEEKKREDELIKQEARQARKEEWDKIRSLGAGARLQYLWDYYKHVLLILLAAVLIIHVAATAIKGARIQTLLYVCLVNTDSMGAGGEQMLADFKEQIGGINEKRQQITFDTSLYINPYSNGATRQDITASVKMTTLVHAGMLDAMIAPEDATVYVQQEGYLLPLDDVLDAEMTERLSAAGCLYYDDEPPQVLTEMGVMTEAADAGAPQEITHGVNTEPEEGQKIYAVRVDQTGVLEKYGLYAGREVWFSLTGSTRHPDMAKELLSFLLEEQS